MTYQEELAIIGFQTYEKDDDLVEAIKTFRKGLARETRAEKRLHDVGIYGSKTPKKKRRARRPASPASGGYGLGEDRAETL